MEAKQGNLSVHTENIFPIIKKFLYSDHEIFLRELVSNAVDATQKLKMMASSGEFDDDLGDLTIKVEVDKSKKTITVSDHGIGMTEEEVDKYINQIAFSSAEEFIHKYADKSEGTNIIGHFGLGFYSAFMVSEKVELLTRSWRKDAEAVKWSCVGNTSFDMKGGKKKERGTKITLHITEESNEFLEESRIEGILKKYCSFMPVDIEFAGRKMNNPQPLWLKKPGDITAQEYKDFYSELYPYSEPPLFWIHLNVDYPFNLTGILYFPKLNQSFELQKNKIHLYSNQVFVTDEVKEIIPEFLTLLNGVIDSPDIPLNVSRSYLQSDSNVKKISSYIVKKVGDRLGEIFKENRAEFEGKWEDIGMFIKFGMLTDDKFYDKAKDFCLVQDIDNKYYTLDEYKEKTTTLQTDKEGQLVWLYASHPSMQDSYIETAKKREYSVLKLEHPIDLHFVQMLETKIDKLSVKRVDAATIDKLIDKDEKTESVLGKEDEAKIEELLKGIINQGQFTLKMEAHATEQAPIIITQSEWMRRMKDMQRMQGAGGMDFPGGYELIVNTNHRLYKKILDAPEAGQKHSIAQQLYDLARLEQGLLAGKELTEFVGRSVGMIG